MSGDGLPAGAGAQEGCPCKGLDGVRAGRSGTRPSGSGAAARRPTAAGPTRAHFRPARAAGARASPRARHRASRREENRIARCCASTRCGAGGVQVGWHHACVFTLPAPTPEQPLDHTCHPGGPQGSRTEGAPGDGAARLGATSRTGHGRRCRGRRGRRALVHECPGPAGQRADAAGQRAGAEGRRPGEGRPLPRDGRPGHGAVHRRGREPRPRQGGRAAGRHLQPSANHEGFTARPAHHRQHPRRLRPHQCVEATSKGAGASGGCRRRVHGAGHP